jgi:hypothetical protein
MTAPSSMRGAVRRSRAELNGLLPRAYRGGLRQEQSPIGAVAQWRSGAEWLPGLEAPHCANPIKGARSARQRARDEKLAQVRAVRAALKAMLR